MIRYDFHIEAVALGTIIMLLSSSSLSALASIRIDTANIKTVQKRPSTLSFEDSVQSQIVAETIQSAIEREPGTCISLSRRPFLYNVSADIFSKHTTKLGVSKKDAKAAHRKRRAPPPLMSGQQSELLNRLGFHKVTPNECSTSVTEIGFPLTSGPHVLNSFTVHYRCSSGLLVLLALRAGNHGWKVAAKAYEPTSSPMVPPCDPYEIVGSNYRQHALFKKQG